MIVREILDPKYNIQTFDQFNDSIDTLRFLRTKILFTPFNHARKLRAMTHDILNSLGFINKSDGMYEDMDYQAKFDKLYLMLDRKYEVRHDFPRTAK